MYEDFDDFSTLPKQFRCVPHLLNLVGTTDFENRLKKSDRCCEILKTAYRKLNQFWCASRSTVANEIIQRVCNRSFPHPNLTRWNSKFDSISVAERHKIKVNEAIDEVNREAIKNAPRNKNAKCLETITLLEWKVLKDYCSCLQPIAIALDILQGEKRSCQGYILPTLYGIKASLDEQLEKKCMCRNMEKYCTIVPWNR